MDFRIEEPLVSEPDLITVGGGRNGRRRRGGRWIGRWKGKRERSRELGEIDRNGMGRKPFYL